MYLANKRIAPMLTQDQSWRIMRLKIARETGWTLEYIEDLSVQDVYDLQSMFEGEAKANG